MRFSVLGSGSSGNSSFLQSDNFGLLIDVGFGPRQMKQRLNSIGCTWDDVTAVLITHTHRDHWNDKSFKKILQHQVPIYCHGSHMASFRNKCPSYSDLKLGGWLRTFKEDKKLDLGSGIECYPIEVSHDGGRTFAHRIEFGGDLFGDPWSVGYVTDLGTWDDSTAKHFANSSVLAIEFNYDDRMQQVSARPQYLIDRVLSDHGHLSNEQAAAFLKKIIEYSQIASLQNVVQLHLSRECNRPQIALAAAREVLVDMDMEIPVVASQQDAAVEIVGPKIKSQVTSN